MGVNQPHITQLAVPDVTLKARILQVLLITLIGGGLRFWNPGRQSAWLDEVITSYRISGSYSDLIASLSNQGFGPAYYSLLYAFKTVMAWFLGDGALVFRPGVLRMVPAMCGTLVVPSMYILARQFRALAEHRWAMLAAGLAAINPYAIYYARDLKMYGLLATLFALQMAMFLRFLNNHRKRDFTASALVLSAITLTHFTACWLVVIHISTLATTRRYRRWTVVLAVMAMWLLAATGPLVWYARGTDFMRRFSDNRDSVGIAWIGKTYTLDANLIAETPALFLTGLGIPKTPPSPALREYFQLSDQVTLSSALANLIRLALLFVAAIAVVGQLRWNRITERPVSPSDFDRFAPKRLLFVWAMLPVALLVMMSLPRSNVLSVYPHYMLFQPRFLIVCWPAMILLLTMAIQNLPSFNRMPLRSVCVFVMGSIMLTSSLTNPLSYRLPPHSQMCEAALPYFQSDNPSSLVLVESRADYTDFDSVYACEVTFGYRPRFDLKYIQTWRAGFAQMPLQSPMRLNDDPQIWFKNLHAIANARSPRTIVTFDRLGDTPLLGDAEILSCLGVGWSKRQQADSRLRYEWHPYLSYGYRARVWQRSS